MNPHTNITIINSGPLSIHRPRCGGMELTTVIVIKEFKNIDTWYKKIK